MNVYAPIYKNPKVDNAVALFFELTILFKYTLLRLLNIEEEAIRNIMKTEPIMTGTNFIPTKDKVNNRTTIVRTIFLLKFL